jgi:hypothetical protein
VVTQFNFFCTSYRNIYITEAFIVLTDVKLSNTTSATKQSKTAVVTFKKHSTELSEHTKVLIFESVTL